MSVEPTGLREAKKLETRQLISDHATRLFMQQGFEATTIAEIAAAARVAKKTVTNYFARKEDLALDHHEAFSNSLANTVAERADGESALTALRRSFDAALETRDPVAGFAGPAFSRMIADSPTLTARLRDLHDQREHALAHALVTATDAAPGDITPAPLPPNSPPPTASCSPASRNSPSPATTTTTSPPPSPPKPPTSSPSSNPHSPPMPRVDPTVGGSG